MSWLTVIVLGRILAESGSPPPDVDDQTLLLIKRKSVSIGCTPGDAGTLGDAATDAVLPDAGPAPDAGPSDAGVGDAGTTDAGMPDAGTCESIPGDAVTMILQPHVSATADGTRFAVLLVTPKRPLVELAGDVFSGLARASGPRIETHTVEIQDPTYGQQCAGGCSDNSNDDGCGGDFGSDSTWTPPGLHDAGLGDGAVVSETIGPYQLIRAQPTSTTELAGWLDQLGYAYMPADLDAVAPYIDLRYHVVAVRVALDKPMFAPMIPIALTWPGSELRVPAALGHGAVSPGTLTVYVAAEGRYEFANAKIRFAGRTSSSLESGFLTRNEIMLDQNQPPAYDPVAYRVLDTELQEVRVVTKEVHVPVEVDCSQQEDGGCCNDCDTRPTARSRTRYDMLSIVAALAFVLRRPRRRKDR